MNQTPYNGNTVEQYHYQTERCDVCHGSGAIPMDKPEMKQIITELVTQIPVIRILKIYHDWKMTGAVTCPECEGKGTWERKI